MFVRCWICPGPPRSWHPMHFEAQSSQHYRQDSSFSLDWTKNKQKPLHSSRTVAILWPAWTSWSPRRVDASQLCSYEDNKPFWLHLILYKFTSRKDDPLHLMTAKQNKMKALDFWCHMCREEFNIDLRLLSLGRPACKADSWLVSGYSGCRRTSTIPWWVAHSAKAICTMWFMLSTYFPSESV